MRATVTSKGQVTIPKEVRDLLHLRAHDKVDLVVDGDRVLMAPVKTLLDLRGAVRTDGKDDFPQERARAKAAAAKGVREEMK